MVGGGCSSYRTLSVPDALRHSGFSISYNKFGMGIYGLISIAGAVTPIHLVTYSPSVPGLICAAPADWGRRGEPSRLMRLE